MGTYNPSNFRWLTSSEDDADQTVGGIVVKMKIGTGDNHYLGDVVYADGNSMEVSKTTVASLHTKRVGVVVGGDALGGFVVTDKSLYGNNTLAASSGTVLVCVLGVAYVVTDGAITAGSVIAPSTTTAGRVRAASVITATATAPTITAPTISTPVITATVNAGATAVTSTAANGAIITASSSTPTATAPTATAPTVTVAGDGFNKILGILLESTTGAGQAAMALISLS